MSELGPMGDSANLNGDLTTVTWTSVEKIDEKADLKEELKEAAQEEKKVMITF